MSSKRISLSLPDAPDRYSIGLLIQTARPAETFVKFGQSTNACRCFRSAVCEGKALILRYDYDLAHAVAIMFQLVERGADLSQWTGMRDQRREHALMGAQQFQRLLGFVVGT